MNLTLRSLTACIRITGISLANTYAHDKKVNSFENQPLCICKALCPKITGHELMLHTPAGVSRTSMVFKLLNYL